MASFDPDTWKEPDETWVPGDPLYRPQVYGSLSPQPLRTGMTTSMFWAEKYRAQEEVWSWLEEPRRKETTADEDAA